MRAGAPTLGSFFWNFRAECLLVGRKKRTAEVIPKIKAQRSKALKTIRLIAKRWGVLMWGDGGVCVTELRKV